jgi:Protein of unknown function (DUF3305)
MTTDPRPSLELAVVVERTAAPNRWEDWAFRIAEVVPDEGAYGREPRVLVDDGRHARLLVPGFRVALYADECKGYFLNLTSGIDGSPSRTSHDTNHDGWPDVRLRK